MNIIVIIPTGIGCEIGGHAGDANPVIKLFASMCNNLITHPNAVNASDINEMTENTLYVEGSILDRFLRGEIFLKKIFYNKILLAVNKPIDTNTQNAVNAARVTIGADIELVELNTQLTMNGFYDTNGKASGKIDGWLELCEQIKDYDFDALAIQSFISVDEKVKEKYFNGVGGVNPWGGIEAIASKLIADKLDKPVAHAPYLTNEHLLEDDKKYGSIISDPRIAAEMISNCYLHCILKGLHKAPLIDYNKGLSVKDIDFLITPIDCVGEPHYACLSAGIPIIAVKENKNCLNDKMPDNFIIAENYLEAAGIISSYKSGINYKSVIRPVEQLKIY